MAAKMSPLETALAKEMTRQTGTIESPSGRTLVVVSMEVDGAFHITVDRDGRRMHDFSANYEQAGADGEPKRAGS